jgi:hypothetical protein
VPAPKLWHIKLRLRSYSLKIGNEEVIY